MKGVFRVWAWIFVAAAIVQVGLAGYGAFYTAHKVDNASIDEDIFEDGFGIHAGFGYLVVLIGLLLLIFALIARPGRTLVIRSAVLFGLLILQVVLAWIGFEVPAIGFFHPINALLIIGLGFSIAWIAWQSRRAVAAAPAV